MACSCRTCWHTSAYHRHEFDLPARTCFLKDVLQASSSTGFDTLTAQTIAIQFYLGLLQMNCITSGVSLPRFAMWTKTLTLRSGLCFGLGNRCRRKAGTFRHDLTPIMIDPLESTKIQDACARPAHCPWKSAAGWHLPSSKLCFIGLHLCRFPEQVKMLTSWFS